MSALAISPRSLTTTPSHLEITFTITNPPSAASSVAAGNPIAPATYLQLSFDFGDGCVVFPDGAMFTMRDIVSAPTGLPGEKLIRLERTEMPKRKGGQTNEEMMTAEVRIYAWKGEKMLGEWVVGRLGGETEVAVR